MTWKPVARRPVDQSTTRQRRSWRATPIRANFDSDATRPPACPARPERSRRACPARPERSRRACLARPARPDSM